MKLKCACGLFFALLAWGCERQQAAPQGKGQPSKTPRSSQAKTLRAPLPKTPPDAVAGSVIVRERHVSGGVVASVRARCASKTERLIGGGCHGSLAMTGWPFSYSLTDTIGAGWECGYEPGTDSKGVAAAFALCQVLGSTKDLPEVKPGPSKKKP